MTKNAKVGRQAPKSDEPASQRAPQSVDKVVLITLITQWLTFFLAVAILLGTIGYMVFNGIQQSQKADQLTTEVAGWPYPKAKVELEQAIRYNKELAAKPKSERIIGDVMDGDASYARKDKEYMGMLNADSIGSMGSVEIPKISVKIPIHHTTDARALADGAGHLYGSSLPAGNKGSHSVISAHSGEIDALLFTRLHELKKGDFFYLRIMGGVQGYKVNDIRVIQPDDFSYFYTSDPHKAIVTLLTCTPIGINTQRLLVTGVRAKIPMPIPDPDTQSDPVYFWGAIAAGILLIAVIIWFTHRLRAQRRSRYAHSSAHHLSSYAAHSSFDLEGYKPPRRER